MFKMSPLLPVVGVEESMYISRSVVVGPYDIVQTALGVSVYELRRLQETVAALTSTTTLAMLPVMMFEGTVYRETKQLLSWHNNIIIHLLQFYILTSKLLKKRFINKI